MKSLLHFPINEQRKREQVRLAWSGPDFTDCGDAETVMSHEFKLASGAGKSERFDELTDAIKALLECGIDQATLSCVAVISTGPKSSVIRRCQFDPRDNEWTGWTSP